MFTERAGARNPAEDHPGVEDCFEDCFEDAVDVAQPEEPEEKLESRNQQLVVKSTFLDVMDGFSARQQFKSLRRAQSDPVLEAEAPAAYEPGQLEDSASRAQTSETTGSVAELSKTEVVEDGRGIEASRSDDEQSNDDERTTVMLRNLPNNYTRDMFLQMMDQNGFKGRYDFAYLPFDFGRNANLGYAFVNMVRPADVVSFRRVFQGYSKWSLPTSKVCQVSWSGPHQGFDAHVARYRNSPVMHRSVPDEYKPIIFKAGVRQEFPPPTRRLKPPARFAGR